MHGDRRIGPHQYLLNDLFAAGDAQTICDELENSQMIVKGNPGESFLLNHAVSFNGPMYQVYILSFFFFLIKLFHHSYRYSMLMNFLS